MPRDLHRPAPLTPVLIASSLLLTLLAAAPPAAASRAGDPDVPAQAPVALATPPGMLGPPTLPAPPAPGGQSIIRRDLHRLLSAPTFRLWAAGGAMALAAHDGENPDRAEASLGTGAIDVPADMGNLYGSGITLGAGSLLLYAAGHLADDANLRGAGSEMARSLAYSTVIVSALKVAVGRTRPNGGSGSFPSGHTTAAFAMAPVLSRRFGPRAAIPAYALAVATGLGRMEDRKHYLSDVVMGAAIGLSIGRAVAGPDTNAAGPQLSLGPGGASVTVRF